MRGHSLIAISQRTLVLLVLSSLTLAAAAYGQDGWTSSFSKVTRIKSTGPYESGQVDWIFESFSPLELEPSLSATFEVTGQPNPARADVLPGQNRLVFSDPKPGLLPNPEARGGASDAPFYTRAEGSIVALGWVDEEFTDAVVSADVNIEGGPGSAGSASRQGVLARWDKSNNWYWFFVNYANGEFGLWKTSFYGHQQAVPGASGRIKDFDNTKAYHVEFEMKGATLRGKVYDTGGRGGASRLVGDSGPIVDKEPLLKGVSGFMAGLALEAPYVPLHGSFANLSSKPLDGGAKAAAKGPTLANLQAEATKSPESFPARFAFAKALADSGRAREAVNEYKAALQRVPNDVQALNNLAWLQATHRDGTVRNPDEAVAHANRAFDALMQATNTRHTTEVTTVFPKTYVLKVAYTAAAAYAAAGLLEQDIPTENTESGTALATTNWAIEVARNEHRKQGTDETAEILKRFENAERLYRQGKTLVGEEQL